MFYFLWLNMLKHLFLNPQNIKCIIKNKLYYHVKPGEIMNYFWTYNRFHFNKWNDSPFAV